MKSFLNVGRKRKNSETWHVVYIDLMTNLMVIFVILWSIHQGKPVKVTNKIGDTTARTISLPGDIIFSPGKSFLSMDGKDVFKKLFSKDETGQVLNFEQGGVGKRYLVIHGHTDGDGKKDENFELGFERALAAYHEMNLYSEEIPSHVVLCSHSDNSPVKEIPRSMEGLSPAQIEEVRESKKKNRRITIEDKIEAKVSAE